MLSVVGDTGKDGDDVDRDGLMLVVLHKKKVKN